MALTIKKNKLTLKTSVADIPPPSEDSEAPAPAAEVRMSAAAVPVSKGMRIYTIICAVLGVIATVLFLWLVSIQGMELSFYQSPPTAWPMFTPQMGSAPAPVVVPVAEPPPAPAVPEAAPAAAPNAGDVAAPVPAAPAPPAK